MCTCDLSPRISSAILSLVGCRSTPISRYCRAALSSCHPSQLRSCTAHSNCVWRRAHPSSPVRGSKKVQAALFEVIQLALQQVYAAGAWQHVISCNTPRPRRAMERAGKGTHAGRQSGSTSNYLRECACLHQRYRYSIEIPVQTVRPHTVFLST